MNLDRDQLQLNFQLGRQLKLQLGGQLRGDLYWIAGIQLDLHRVEIQRLVGLV